jgi:predicted MFS family arabinose efflux permease
MTGTHPNAQATGPDATGRDKGTVIAAALALAATGSIFYNLLPLIVGVAQDDRGLAPSQLGLLSAAFFLGFNVVSASSFFWLHRFGQKRIAFTALLLAAAAMLTSSSQSFPLMLTFTAIAGGAFGVLYGLASALIGSTTHQARWFGVKISLEAMLGVVLILILPGTLIAAYGYTGLILGMILAALLLSPAFLALPGAALAADADHAAEGPGDGLMTGERTAIWLALAACLLFFSGQTTVWAFVERLGADAAFEPEAVAGLLSTTLVFAVLGSLSAAALADRLGNLLPFLGACTLFLIGDATLFWSANFTAYSIGACVVMYSTGLGISYCVAEIARLDPDGRHVVLSVPAVGAGAMLGPGIAGFLAEGQGYSSVLVFGAVTVAAAMILLTLASRRATQLAARQLGIH